MARYTIEGSGEFFDTRRDALRALGAIQWSGYVVRIEDPYDDEEPTQFWVRSNSEKDPQGGR